MFRYGVISPRARLATDFDAKALGIEVTDPLAAACCGLGNIDPQHRQPDVVSAPAAIEVCADTTLPPAGARLVTIRPDLDALGAMAVLTLRAEGQAPGATMRARIRRVAEMDRFAHGPWPGPRPLPRTAGELFTSADDAELVPLAVAVADPGLPLAQRVALVERWLRDGAIPAASLHACRRHAETLVASLLTGRTRFLPRLPTVATIVSEQPGALRLAYRRAPIVVAVHPKHRFPDGAIGRKYTIACWSDDVADLEGVGRDIAALEGGWGGHAGIKGSPQDRPSRLPLATIVDVVGRRIRSTWSRYHLCSTCSSPLSAAPRRSSPRLCGR